MFLFTLSLLGRRYIFGHTKNRAPRPVPRRADISSRFSAHSSPLVRGRSPRRSTNKCDRAILRHRERGVSIVTRRRRVGSSSATEQTRFSWRSRFAARDDCAIFASRSQFALEPLRLADECTRASRLALARGFTGNGEQLERTSWRPTPSCAPTLLATRVNRYPLLFPSIPLALR